MDKKLVKKLCKDFPIFFPSPSTKVLSFFRFRCGDGWEPLIRELATKIETYNNSNSSSPVIANTVKEKFGTLNVYIESGKIPDSIYDLIHEYSNKSAHICELCGDKGERRLGKWVSTTCNLCYLGFKRLPKNPYRTR